MTDADRLAVALELAELGRRLTWERLVREHPECDEAQIGAMFEALTPPLLEDSLIRSVPWPRHGSESKER
jgi:hypothetical protein